MKSLLALLISLEHSGAYYNEVFHHFEELIYKRSKEQIDADLIELDNYNYPKNGRFRQLVALLIKDRFG